LHDVGADTKPGRSTDPHPARAGECACPFQTFRQLRRKFHLCDYKRARVLGGLPSQARRQVRVFYTPAPKLLTRNTNQSVETAPISRRPQDAPGSCATHFRSTPISGHFQSPSACLKGAMRRLMRCSKNTAYSITEVAVTNRLFGKVMPSSFAVLRLSARSNFVGCSARVKYKQEARYGRGNLRQSLPGPRVCDGNIPRPASVESQSPI